MIFLFERRNRWSGFKILGLIAVTSILTGMFLLIALPKIVMYKKPQENRNILYNQNNINAVPQQSVGAVNDTETVVTRASSNVLPSVVGISALTLTKDKIFDSGGAGKWGVGSGIIVSNNGYIITNNHVAGGKARIVVTLENGSVVEGKTIWADPVLDLAVVKIDASGLHTATLGDNNTVKVGDIAIAIGNPLGLQFQRTVTSGVISGLNRTISVEGPEGSNFMEDLIQTDALINPGNSGGPLVNARGEVVGINTVKIQTAEGMGFAIPINIVKPIVKDFIEKGNHVSPHIGIFAYDKNVMNYIDNNINIDKGIYVATVDNNGPAFKSGIKVGDVITHVDNVEVNTMMDLRTYIYNKGIGTPVTVNYYSGGKPQTARVVLEAKPDGNGITR